MASPHTRPCKVVVEDWRSTPIGLLNHWLWRNYLPSKRLPKPTTTNSLTWRPYTPVGTKTSSRNEGEPILAYLTFEYELPPFEASPKTPQQLTPWHGVPTHPLEQRRRREMKVNPYWPTWPLNMNYLPSKLLPKPTTPDALIWRPYTPVGTKTSSRNEGEPILTCLTPDYEGTTSLRSVSLTRTTTDALIRRPHTTFDTKTPGTKEANQSSKYSQIRLTLEGVCKVMLCGLVETSRRFIRTVVRAWCVECVCSGVVQPQDGRGQVAMRRDRPLSSFVFQPPVLFMHCTVDVREVLVDLLWGYCLHRQHSVNATAYSTTHICTAKCDVTDMTLSL
jgi:hypothetical protein